MVNKVIHYVPLQTADGAEPLAALTCIGLRLFITRDVAVHLTVNK